MKPKSISLILAVVLSGCLWNPFSSRAPLEEDRSIVFPQFFEEEAIEVGAGGEPYELDGEMLQALVIAANDFLPPGARNPPCSSRQEAQLYRVIRRGDIVFVYIHENHAYCGRAYPALDSGAKYAIRDGRIVRRILDGQPTGLVEPESPDAGDDGFTAEPGVSPTFEALWNEPSDGGVPDGGSTGSKTTDEDAGSADAGPRTEAPVEPPTLMPADAIAKEKSKQVLLSDFAEALQWNVEDEPLDSFWEAVESLEDGSWQFTLVHLAKHTEPRGGMQQWLVVRKHRKDGPIAYSSLITQYPFTPDYWQQVKPIGMALQPLEDSSSRVLWVRLRESFSESENGGEHVTDKERQFAYAFLVDDRGTFKALALKIPEKVTLSVDDEVTAETSLEVNIPSTDRLIIRPGPTGVDAEQQAWLGEHSLTK